DLSANVIQDGVVYLHSNNHKIAQSTGTSRSQAQNIQQYSFIDGDNYIPGDSGEWCHQYGGFKCNYSIDINNQGNLIDTVNSSDPENATADHNTLWNQTSGVVGETAGSATQLQEYYDNIFDHPANAASSFCSTYEAGIVQASAYITQTVGNEDNNLYYGFPNTGDIGARSCTLSGQVGLVYKGIWGMPQSVRGSLSSKTVTGVSGNQITCSGCNFTQSGESGVQLYDVFYNTNDKTFATVVSVDSSTAATLTSTASLTTGAGHNTFTVYKEPWATPALIGSATNRGANDIHAPAQFFNPGDGTCPWYNKVTGASLSCQLTASSSSSVTPFLTI